MNDIANKSQDRWKKCILGDIVTFNYGKSLPENKRKKGSIPVYSSAGLTGWHNIALTDSKGIIIGRKGTIGKIYKSYKPFFAIDTSYYILPNSLVYDFEYLYYLLITLELDSLNEDSAVPGLNRNTAYSQDISLPPLPEQKAIAEVLSSLDNKIDLLHRQNKTLEDLAQTLFREWFVEKADDGWEAMNLGDVIDIFDNKRIPLSKMQRDNMKEGKLYPYYGAAKIMDYVNDYIFNGEYILLGEDGTVITDEGFPVLQYATGKFWVNNHTHVLQAKKPYTNYFIWNYLLNKNIEKIVTGAVQPKISQTNLKSLSFLNFPKNLIEKFNDLTKVWLQKINKNKLQINNLICIRDTLLPKLISGEIRVAYD
ncbi:restriction endonuclease subunit S [Thiotrichales bacterium 19X7-9]|nr:restriction endonuclease subunit S [Thiotrichales bacterium 19X7-9]